MSVASRQPSPAANDKRTELSFGACTDRAGREVNEDNCTLEPLQRVGREHLGLLAAVADGMGGGEAGKTASTLAIGAIGEAYFESDLDNPLQALQQAVSQANSAVYAFTVNARKAGVVGTTMIAAALVGSRVAIVSVGDSRAYRIRGGQAIQLTIDHNWANQQIELGRMTPEQAFAHENAPLLTNVLGQGASLQIAQGGQPDGKFSFYLDLQPGDAIVLCSDGVSGVVPPQELATLALSAPAPRAAEQIVARARALRTSDNATAVVVQYGNGGRRVRSGRWMLLGGGVGATLLALVVGFLFAFPSNPSNGQNSTPTPPSQVTAPTTTSGGNQIIVAPTIAAQESEQIPDTGRATSTVLPATATPTVGSAANTPQPAATGSGSNQPRPTPPTATPSQLPTQIPTVTMELQPTATESPSATNPPPTATNTAVPPTPTRPPPPTETPPPPPTEAPPPPPTEAPPPPPTEAPPPPDETATPP